MEAMTKDILHPPYLNSTLAKSTTPAQGGSVCACLEGSQYLGIFDDHNYKGGLLENCILVEIDDRWL